MLYADRTDAGRQLARRLEHLRGEDLVVLGLPRGGVPVASEVARALNVPLDVIVVRKLGVPLQPELGMGAVGEDGVRVLDRGVIRSARVTERDLVEVEERERVELDQRVKRFRGGRPRVPLDGRTAVVVDDGIATGSTARAACQVARAHGAARIVLAVPVAPSGWSTGPGDDVDEFVCLDSPEDFFAVGQFYRDFTQTTDDEVIAYTELARSASASRDVATSRNRPAGVQPQVVDDVEIPAGHVSLAGYLTVPADALGIVVFAHGSGSSRFSPRNRFVADVLHDAGIGTLLFDLLTLEEEADRANVFDVEMLASRLVDVTRWLTVQSGIRTLPIGYFGASTGAAAALWASADADIDVAAVVSRGGRPDLAGPRLPAVTAPTLLIVGSLDNVVLDLNLDAQSHLTCENRLAVVADATHLFEEPGTLREASELARDWFLAHLAGVEHRSSQRGSDGPLWRDPALEAACEEAAGAEPYEYRPGEAALAEHEAAQGVEVFSNPDDVVPASALVEGSPGHETFVGEQIGVGMDVEGESRERIAEESYDA